MSARSKRHDLKAFRAASTAAMFLAASFVCGELALADLKGNAEFLKLVASAHRSNRQRIESWQGRVRVVEGSEVPAGIRTTSDVSFYYDAAKERLRWDWKITDVDNATGREVPATIRKGNIENHLLTDGMRYIFATDWSKKPTDRKRLVVRASSDMNVNSLMIGQFEPMWHLRTPGGTGDIAEFLLFLHREARNPKLKNVTVARRGNIVTLEQISGTVVNRHIFDLSKAGNCISSYFGESRQKTDYTYKWEKVNAVWVPNRFKFRRQQFDDKGNRRVATREVTWLENRVNEDIDPEVFDVEAFKKQLKPGDYVQDNRTNTLSVHEPAKAGEENLKAEGSSTRWYVILVSIGALLLIAAVTWFIRGRRAPA